MRLTDRAAGLNLLVCVGTEWKTAGRAIFIDVDAPAIGWRLCDPVAPSIRHDGGVIGKHEAFVNPNAPVKVAQVG